MLCFIRLVLVSLYYILLSICAAFRASVKALFFGFIQMPFVGGGRLQRSDGLCQRDGGTSQRTGGR